jgi:hypothetical protein
MMKTGAPVDLSIRAIAAMMALGVLGCAVAATSVMEPSEPYFKPTRVPWQGLSHGCPKARLMLMDALRLEGMVAVTGVPKYEIYVQETLSWNTFHKCVVNEHNHYFKTKSHAFDDGTVRHTIATQDVFPEGMEQLELDLDLVGEDSINGDEEDEPLPFLSDDTAACTAFEESSSKLRHVIADATHLFGRIVAQELNLTAPLLESFLGEDDAADFNFESFEQVVTQGHHLEHFHSYQEVVNSNTNDETTNEQEDSTDATISMHTDQGLFIAFVPGRFVSASHDGSSISKGFMLQLQDGSVAEAQFDSGDLVFMLGDGMNHVVNPRLVEMGAPTLRAVPHSLDMSRTKGSMSITSDSEEARVETARLWYGRMVLPPPTAFSDEFGMTFGELRSKLIGDGDESSSHHHAANIGCSSQSQMAARQLEESSCADGEMYCWHRCMLPAASNISDTMCAETGQFLTCSNVNGALWDDTHNPDWSLYCTDDKPNVTSKGSNVDTPSKACFISVTMTLATTIIVASIWTATF